ncbi:MAG: aldehyde dehydrogenase (NADP(+)) [Fimbriimonadaceae bacterium]|nr:aldehyde dehydrogenase (NADP(+)) [Fimbriimonadaceae bacterium]
MLKGLSFIGISRGSAGGQRFTVKSRLTGESLSGEFHTALQTEVDDAATLAGKAFPTFAAAGRLKRAEFLRAIATQIEAGKEAIIQRATHETALPEGRIMGEIGRTCGQLRFFAAILEGGSYQDVRIDHADPDRQPLPKPDVRSMKQPIGPVAVFGASNFPLAFAVAGGDSASALAAGCPVVVKAHPAHPGTSELVANAIVAAAQETGMPEGVFSMLFDERYEIGQVLVQHESIKGVGFTGSRSGGLAIQKLAQSRPTPIPVYAEMSSINPVVVMPDKLATDPEGFATGLHASVTLGVGQFCTNPGVAFIVGMEGLEAFKSRFAQLMSETPCGTMLTEGIGEHYLRMVRRISGLKGVTPIVSADKPGETSVFEVSAATFMHESEVRDEVFGPETLLVICDSIEEAAQAIAVMEGQLTGTIHATPTDLAHAAPILNVLTRIAGRVILNQFPTGVEVCQAMVHGGPFPATTDGQSTSVGGRAIDRWLRPVCYQNFPRELLPKELRG